MSSSHLIDLIQLGFMNKIATGYPFLDIILCILIPWVIIKIGELMKNKHTFSLTNVIQFIKCVKVIEREIKYVMITNECGPVFDIHNRYMQRLQDAILRYINKHDFVKGGNLKDGLVSVDVDNDDVILQPASNKWIILKNDITLRIHRFEDKGEKYLFNCNVFTLKAKSDIIDSFIKMCYNEYMETRYVANKSCHYMFMPHFQNEKVITFDKYKLEDSKTFSLLFHPQTDEVTNLLDDFMNKRGRFNIKGFPYKLGFLLHGKPGTGKTSFIKALRAYTNRHIINVSLSKIKTNQQLIDLMFSTRLIARNDDPEVHITFDSVIYVLEDIDVLADIVRTRGRVNTVKNNKSRSILKSKKNCSCNDSNDDSNDSNDDSNYSNDDSNDSNDDSNDNDEDDDADESRSSKKKASLDKLNLAGLLNVLDGILETPGRIVVMTTNHPEHLDPALIRPGRINKTIHMGNIDVVSAIKMIEYYVGAVTPAQRHFIMENFPIDTITPAFLESKCMDFANVDAVIAWIESYKMSDITDHKQL